MPYYGQKKGRLAFAPKATAQPATVPSSVGGINSLSALNAMPPEDCIYTYNLMPVEYGLELRKGYREWATGAGTNDVRTILNYESNKVGIINDRLWAVTNEGIWDISNFGETAPNQDVVFLDNTEPAGYGVKAEFTDDSGEHYMFYADGVNGIWQFSDSADAWTQPISGTGAGEWSFDPPGPGPVTGFPVDDVAFVMLHKLRIWVVLEDSDDAWYLPVGAIAGELKRFIFGAKMPRGGRLMGLWNWTIDGGDGVDDYLIAIGRAGDVIVYRGDDPEIVVTSTAGEAGAPWSQTGSWYIGDMTATRRPVVEYGGEMYILSAFGLTNLSDLLRGSAVNAVRSSPSAKVTRFLRRDVLAGLSGHGWSLTINPADGFLQIITPEPSNSPYVQYNQNLTTKAWGLWENVPMLCGEEWNGEYFMGGKNGVTYIYDGGLDNTTIDGPNDWTDVLSSAGAEWTQPLALEYACDGTQIADTAYTIVASQTLKAGIDYDYLYTITNFSAGNHGMILGGVDQSALSAGDGTFAGVLRVTADTTLAAVLGDLDFVGTFSLVSVTESAILGQPINFRTLTSFQVYGATHGTFKRVGFIRTIGVTSGVIDFNVQAVYDYDISAVVQPPVVPPPPPGASRWNSAVWNQSLWAGGLTGGSLPTGALGLGRSVAIGINGSAENRISIVAWDITITEGNVL